MRTYLNAHEYTDDEGNIYREYYTSNDLRLDITKVKEPVSNLTKELATEICKKALGCYEANETVTLCAGKGNWVPEITRVIFNYPATIVFWADGTKTAVKMQNPWLEDDDPEKGLAMAIAKKALGNQGNYYEVFKKYLKEGGYYG